MYVALTDNDEEPPVGELAGLRLIDAAGALVWIYLQCPCLFSVYPEQIITPSSPKDVQSPVVRTLVR